MKELVVKKCMKCGAIVKVINDCNCENCGIMCCGEAMKELEPNTVDASFEKHIPNYEKEEDKIVVTVNHPMDEDHYIEWVAMVSEERECFVKFMPGDEIKCDFRYIPGSKIYSYCNKHGLWMKEVL